MKVKLTSGLIIIIILLNAVFISWNLEFRADAPESNNKMISRGVPRPLNIGDMNWSKIQVISEPVFGQNFNTGHSVWQSIAAENGNIYVVWDDSNNTNGAGGGQDIFFRFYNGTNWSEIQVISEPVFGQNFNTKQTKYAKIAVENGSIYVVWGCRNDTNGAGTDWDVFFRCNLTGSGWGPIQVISEPVVGQNFNTANSLPNYPDIAVENGKIYVVWNDKNNTNGAGDDNDIFYRCNLTGTSWESVQVISEPIPGQNISTGGSYPEIAVENGKIYCAWSSGNNTDNSGTDADIFYRSNLTGNFWEHIQVISEPVPGQNFNTGNSWMGEIAVENGKIYVVWHDRNDTYGAGGFNDDIFFKCNLTGTNWEPVQVISESVLGADHNVFHSGGEKIAVEKNTIHITWNDRNNTLGSGTDGDTFYRCNLTGNSWEDIEVVSEPVPGFNFNTHGGGLSDIAIDQDKCHIVWSDSNNTNGAGTDNDISYRWKNLVKPSLFLWAPGLTPNWGNTSTEFNFSVTYFQLNNTPPSRMKVKIDGIEHSMRNWYSYL
jgi:hypothetical protein